MSCWEEAAPGDVPGDVLARDSWGSEADWKGLVSDQDVDVDSSIPGFLAGCVNYRCDSSSGLGHGLNSLNCHTCTHQSAGSPCLVVAKRRNVETAKRNSELDHISFMEKNPFPFPSHPSSSSSSSPSPSPSPSRSLSSLSALASCTARHSPTSCRVGSGVQPFPPA